MDETVDFDFYDPIESLEDKSLLTMQRNTLEEENLCDGTFPKPENHHQKLKRNCYIPVLGALMGMTSGLCFSICSIIVKYLKHIDPFELSTIRFVGVFMPAAVIVVWTNENPLGPEGKRIYLLLRGIFGTVNLILQFYALQAMPLGDASAIIFSAPVFVAIFARIFLKEYFGIFHVIMILMTVCGVILITRPPFLFTYEHGYSEEILNGVIAAIGAMIVNSNIFILLRCLKDVHYSVVLVAFGIIGTTVSGSTTLIFGKVSDMFSNNNNIILIVVFMVLSFSGQMLLTKASQLDQAGPVSIYRASDVVFAFIWQVIFFKEVLNVFSVIGALLISASVILTGWHKWSMSR